MRRRRRARSRIAVSAGQVRRCGGGASAVAQCKEEFFFDPEAGGPGAGITVFVAADSIAKQIDEYRAEVALSRRWQTA